MQENLAPLLYNSRKDIDSLCIFLFLLTASKEGKYNILKFLLHGMLLVGQISLQSTSPPPPESFELFSLS